MMMDLHLLVFVCRVFLCFHQYVEVDLRGCLPPKKFIYFADLKSMISVGLSSIHCAGFNVELVAQGVSKMRCLCMGLGGGSLPLFLANKLQGCFVEVVEIDKTVISAATEFMGFPASGFKYPQISGQGLKFSSSTNDYSSGKEGMDAQVHCQMKFRGGSTALWAKLPDRISGVEADGVTYVGHLAKDMGLKEQKQYDLVFIDAFDGKDEVPSCFWSRGGSFLGGLCDLLNPHHGTAVVNLHTDSLPPSFLERITGDFGPGFDPLLPGGKLLQEISHAYRDELLQGWSDGQLNAVGGVAFTVAVPRQQNICLVVSRGVTGVKASILQNLMAAACYLERVLDLPFPMSKRVARGFQLVH